MKEIELTQKQVAIVDDDDYEYLSQWKWCANFDKHSHTFRALRGDGNKKIVLMHRVVTNAGKGFVVDHINHNGLDNRKENLRVVTNAQNMMNRKKNIQNKFPKGVSKKGTRYRARIRNLWIGYYGTIEEAAEAYNKKAVELYGDFANLNIMDAK